MPNAPFSVGRSFTVFFSNQGILDLAGNQLTGSNFSFTTSFAADTTGPQVVGVSPVDGLTQVPINAQVMIAFNEPIQSLTVDQVSLKAGAANVAVMRTLSNGNRTLTITPNVPLNASTQYTVGINGVKDLAGNALAAAVTTSFTTGTGADLIRPFVSGTNPVNGASGVATNTTITVAFSERINPLTVSSSTFRVLASNTGIPLTGTIAAAGDGRSISFAPTGGLAASTQYTVQVFSITDLTGQDIGFFQSSFTTGGGGSATSVGSNVLPQGTPRATALIGACARWLAERFDFRRTGALYLGCDVIFNRLP